MIGCKELRIGNLVTYNPSSVDEGTDIVPLEVVSIETDYEKGVALSDGFNNVYGFDEILPIPLTPELLKACGFTPYDEDDNTYSIYGNQGDDSDFFLEFNWLRRENGYTPMIKSAEYEIFSIPIKHLHQLQNLYFALTQTELTIDIKQIA